MGTSKQRENWLSPLILILLMLEVLLLPLAVGQTYAGRSESPHHVLTYIPGQLTWDENTQVDENGSALLELFSTTYDHVVSSNGDSLVAPGTEYETIVRLKNGAGYPIQCVALAFQIKDALTLTVEPLLSGKNFTDTNDYVLPPGVDESPVLRAVTGELGTGEVLDFRISWHWDFYQSQERDTADTALGNQAAWVFPQGLVAGMHILVEEDGEFLVPQTGDTHTIIPYVGLMAACGVLLSVLAVKRRRERT